VAPFDVHDVEELFELRCLLEPPGVSRIVQWDEDRLAELVTLFDRFSQPMPPEEIGDYLHTDDDFHKRIVAATENRRIAGFYHVVDRQIDRIRHFTSYRSQGRVDESLIEHRQICEALARRDADAAARLLVSHIESAARTHVQFMKSAAAATDD
jgi:GntR family transcriptional regulator, rspAB operon transcriptional repressor